MEFLLGIAASIAAIVTFLFFRKSNNVIVDNAKVLDKLKETDIKIDANDKSLKSEEDLRNELKTNLEEKKDETLTLKELADFYNDRK
jgi:hypothetical protein